MTDKSTEKPRFQPGEIVDITIKGARVEEPTDDQGNLEFTYSGDEGLVSFEGVVVPLADAVTVERVAPAEWPPRPGDLWRDRDGDAWYALLVDDDDMADEPYVILRPSRSSKDPGLHFQGDNERIITWHGPLTLAHREPEQDGGES